MNSKIFGPATAERRRRQARLNFIMLPWSRLGRLLTAAGDCEQLTTLDYLPLDLACCCCVIFVWHLLDFLITFITDNMCRDINFIESFGSKDVTSPASKLWRSTMRSYSRYWNLLFHRNLYSHVVQNHKNSSGAWSSYSSHKSHLPAHSSQLFQHLEWGEWKQINSQNSHRM